MTEEATVEEISPERAAELTAQLAGRGDVKAEELAKPREKSINWNKGVEEGDMLAGILERGDKILITGRAEPSYLMEIRDYTTKDLYVVWCSNYQLKKAIIDDAPKVGAFIVVQYHGKQPLDGGKSMNVFTVETEASDHPYWHGIDQAYFKKQAEKAAAPAQVPSFGPDEAPF